MYMMRHLAEYTVFLSEQQNQLYGVKSITTDLADMYPSTALPSLVNAILLPFEGHIFWIPSYSDMPYRLEVKYEKI